MHREERSNGVAKRLNFLGTGFLVGLLIVGCMFVFPNLAGAIPVDLTVTGVKYSRTVTIVFPNLGTQRVKAGEYQMDIVGDPYTGSYGGFCVEDVWAPSGTKGYELLDVSGEPYLRAAYAASMYFAGAPGYDDAAAVQVAIWEIVLETIGSYDVASGNLRHFSGFSAAELTDVQDIVTAAMAANLSSFSAGAFKHAIHPRPNPGNGSNYQDYLVKVSEPTTLLLLGVGLISLVGISRRKVFKK